MLNSNRVSGEREKALAEARAKNAERAAAPPARLRYWIVLQGDVLEMVDADRMPETSTKPGERRKVIVGAFDDRAKAQAYYDEMKHRARGIAGKGEAR